MKPSQVILLALWGLGVIAWFTSVAYQLKGARRTTSGKHWWFHMGSLDPVFHATAWPPEARVFWKKHLIWAGIFVAAVAAAFLVPVER